MPGEVPKEVARDVVGRREELRLLLSAIDHSKAVLLLGLPGVSKTTMVRALARQLGSEADRFVDVTGDEQLSAHILVGTFDPPMVLKAGYRPDFFMPGPLTRAMAAGGILYLEEMNRAPSGALNALMTALSERYIEVPRLGRVEAQAGFTIVGAANPLDDVGTMRLSRGLADRFLVLELDYQPREEELEIVHRRCGDQRGGFHAFAVDVARESRRHPDLRHGASIRAAIDLVDLLGGYDPDELDLTRIRFLACCAFAGKLRVRPTVTRTPCETVHELIDVVLARSYQGSVEVLLEQAMPGPAGQLAEAEGEGLGSLGETGEVALAQGGQRPSRPPERPDEIPGLARPGGSGDAGVSRSVPMVERDRPSAGGTRPVDAQDALDDHLRDLDEVLRRAREQVLRVRDGAEERLVAIPGGALRSAPLTDPAAGPLDVDAAVEAFVAGAGTVQHDELRVLTRQRYTRNYVILVDHSGSMVGRKLELGATLAAVLAQLSAAGRAGYAVLAFDEELRELKRLDEDQDVHEVIDRILRLPEGRATDLAKALTAAAELADGAPDTTDVVLISDCMPTRGVTTFRGLAGLTRQIPSLYICFTDERSAAIQMWGGQRRMDLYQWWARQWAGDQRFQEIGDPEEIDLLVDLLSSDPGNSGP
ncbi:MAG: AAA domain-containing protein [Nitriliruptorales bacterium]|nr:AAA domain-containing protein [Nitriliruptorales bacterium]